MATNRSSNLRVVIGEGSITPADSLEGQLVRAIQKVFDAYNQDEIPMPKDRVRLRADLLGAAERYLADKLHARMITRPGSKK